MILETPVLLSSNGIFKNVSVFSVTSVVDVRG
jgi:hypothetical protein